MAQNSDTIYRDFRYDFAVHPVKGDLLLRANEDAVGEAIKTLLLTKPGERQWQPDLGAGLHAYLFEPITSITEEGIRQSIMATVKNYEPRAELKEVLVTAKPDQNGYVATIIYATRNLIDPVSVTVFLERIR